MHTEQVVGFLECEEPKGSGNPGPLSGMAGARGSRGYESLQADILSIGPGHTGDGQQKWLQALAHCLTLGEYSLFLGLTFPHLSSRGK